jgi:hypothetical protein
MDPALTAKLMALVFLGTIYAILIADTARAGTWHDAARIKPPLYKDVLIEVDKGFDGFAVFMGYWTGHHWQITCYEGPAELEPAVIQWRPCPAPPVFRRAPG